MELNEYLTENRDRQLLTYQILRELIMNKADLIAKLAPKLNITQDEARIVLNSVLEVITEALVEDKNVRLVDFGTFEVKQRAERMGHNLKLAKNLKLKLRKSSLLNKARLWESNLLLSQSKKVKLKRKPNFLSSLFFLFGFILWN